MKTNLQVQHNTNFFYANATEPFLTHSEMARDFLDIHLQPELRQACDLNTLRLESGSFIEENLRAYYSDVLYSLKAGQGDGYIYALIEHQSTPDRHIGLRMMRYAIAAMQRHLKAGNDKLLLVIPFVGYIHFLNT